MRGFDVPLGDALELREGPPEVVVVALDLHGSASIYFSHGRATAVTLCPSALCLGSYRFVGPAIRSCLPRRGAGGRGADLGRVVPEREPEVDLVVAAGPAVGRVDADFRDAVAVAGIDTLHIRGFPRRQWKGVGGESKEAREES